MGVLSIFFVSCFGFDADAPFAAVVGAAGDFDAGATGDGGGAAIGAAFDVSADAGTHGGFGGDAVAQGDFATGFVLCVGVVDGAADLAVCAGAELVAAGETMFCAEFTADAGVGLFFAAWCVGDTSGEACAFAVVAGGLSGGLDVATDFDVWLVAVT